MFRRFCKPNISKRKIEIIIIDGMSSDNSREIVKSYQKLENNILLIENKKKITPISFNLGIKSSKNDVVSIFSAHSEPDPDYIEVAIKT